MHMTSAAAAAFRALLLAAGSAAMLGAMLVTPDAHADCNWAWHCERSGACGFVPSCDAPTEKPPPLRGARLPGDTRRAPLPPGPHARRQPLPGSTPIKAPPAVRPPGTQAGQGRDGGPPS